MPLLPPRLFRLMSWRGLAAAAVVAACASGYLWSVSVRHRKAQEERLVAIADLQARRVASWRGARERQAAALAASPWLAEAAARLAARPGQPELRTAVVALLTTSADSGDGDVLLVDPRGRVLASAPGARTSIDAHLRDLAARAARERRTLLFEPSRAGDDVHVDAAIPLRHGSAVDAVVLFDVPATGRLFEAMSGLPTPTATGEALLVARGAAGVTVLAADRATAVQAGDAPGADALGEVAAALAAPGVVRARGGRGERVVAAIRPVPSLPWSVVVKEDEAELDAPVRELAATVVAGSGFVLLGLWSILFAASRRRAAELRAIELERQRAEARDFDANLLANLQDAVVATDAAWRVVAWNPAAERMYGWTAEEAHRLTIVDLTADPMGPEAQGFRRQLETEGRLRALVRHRRKDGSVIEVDAIVTALHDADGDVIGWVGVQRDTSERRRLEAQLAQAERMAALGTLAAGMAHAMNSPLACAIANVGFAREELAAESPDLGESGRALEDALAGARRAAEVVKSLQVFARSGEAPADVLDLREVVRGAAALAGNDLRHRARVELDLGEAPLVKADPNQLSQLCVQLLVNACQAIPEGNAAAHRVRAATRAEAGRAVLEISDTGRGIPADVRGKIFDPFFTTEAVAGRSGLGLSLCHGIVTALGGEIEVESDEGRGSTFRVRLPAAVPLAAPAAAGAPDDAPRGRILVVDDEPLVLRAVERTLSPQHEVVTTASAREALELLCAPQPFDVVLCDLMMPEMTGMELHAEAVRRAPDVAARMVFLTGGAFTEGARTFLELSSRPRLEKPFDPATLRALAAAEVRSARAARAA